MSYHAATIISTDPAQLDIDAIYAYLNRSYWATGLTVTFEKQALRHSLNFGVYRRRRLEPAQVGLAHVTTDYATFAYLCDVYILERHQSHGLGRSAD